MMLAFAVLATVTVEAPPLRVGTYAYAKFDRRAALTPVADYLSSEMGRRSEIVLYETPERLSLAIERREVDVAMTNLASFLAVANASHVEPMAVLDVPLRTLEGYRAVLAAGSHIPIRTLKDLKGKERALRYVEVLPGSTSGALVQRRSLEAAEIVWQCFARLPDAGTHENALQQLLDRKADLAAFAHEPLKRLQARNPSLAAGVAPIWISAPLPPGPLVCVKQTGLSCDRIRRALLRKSPETKQAAQALAAGWSETLGAERFKEIGRTYEDWRGNRKTKRGDPGNAAECGD